MGGPVNVKLFVLLFLVAVPLHALADATSDISLNAYITILAKNQNKDRQEYIDYLKGFKSCEVQPMQGVFSCKSCYAAYKSVNEFDHCVKSTVEKTKGELDFLSSVRSKRVSDKNKKRIRNHLESKLRRENGNSGVISDADVEAFIDELSKKLDSTIVVAGEQIKLSDYYQQVADKELKFSEENFTSAIDELRSFGPAIAKACEVAATKYNIQCYSPEQELTLYEERRDKKLSSIGDAIGFALNYEELNNDIELYKLCTSSEGKKLFECKHFDPEFYQNIFAKLRAKGGCEFISDPLVCPTSDGSESKIAGVGGSRKASSSGSGSAVGIGKGKVGGRTGGGGDADKSSGDGGIGKKSGRHALQKRREGRKSGSDKSNNSGSHDDEGSIDKKKQNGGGDLCQGENIEFFKSVSWLVGYPINRYNRKPGGNAIADALLCRGEVEAPEIPWREKDPCPMISKIACAESGMPTTGKPLITNESEKLLENLNDLDANLIFAERVAKQLAQSYLAALEKTSFPPNYDEGMRKQYMANKLAHLKVSCAQKSDNRYIANTNQISRAISEFTSLALKEVESTKGFSGNSEQVIIDIIAAKKKIAAIDEKLKLMQKDFGDDTIAKFADYYPDLLPCRQLVEIGASQIQATVNEDSGALCSSADPDEMLKDARSFIGPKDKKDLEELTRKKREITDKVSEYNMTIGLLQKTIDGLKIEKSVIHKKLEDVKSGQKPVKVDISIGQNILEARIWDDPTIGMFADDWKEKIILIDEGVAKAFEEIQKTQKKIEETTKQGEKIAAEWKHKRCSGDNPPTSCSRDISIRNSDRMLQQGISIGDEVLFPPVAINGGEGDKYLCAIKAQAMKRLIAERAKLLAQFVDLTRNIPIPASECTKKSILEVASCFKKSMYENLGIDGGLDLLDDVDAKDSGEMYSNLLALLSPKKIEEDLEAIEEEMAELCGNPKDYVEERLYQDSLANDDLYQSVYNCGEVKGNQRANRVWEKYNRKDLQACNALALNEQADIRICNYRQKALVDPYRQFKKSAWKTKNAFFESLDTGACVAVLGGIGLKVASSVGKTAAGAIARVSAPAGSKVGNISRAALAKSREALRNNFGKFALGMTLTFGGVELLEYQENASKCRRAKVSAHLSSSASNGEADCNPAMEAAYNTVKGLMDGIFYDFAFAQGKVAAKAQRSSGRTKFVDADLDTSAHSTRFVEPSKDGLAMLAGGKTRTKETPPAVTVYAVGSSGKKYPPPKPGHEAQATAADNAFIDPVEHGRVLSSKDTRVIYEEISSELLEEIAEPGQSMTFRAQGFSMTDPAVSTDAHFSQLVTARDSLLKRVTAKFRNADGVEISENASISIKKIEKDYVAKSLEETMRDFLQKKGLKSAEIDARIAELKSNGHFRADFGLNPEDGKAWPAGHPNDPYTTGGRVPVDSDFPPPEYKYIESVNGKTLRDDINEELAKVPVEIESSLVPQIDLDPETKKISEKGVEQARQYFKKYYETDSRPVTVDYHSDGAESLVFKVCIRGNECFAAKLPKVLNKVKEGSDAHISLTRDHANKSIFTSVLKKSMAKAMERVTYKGRKIARIIESPSNSAQSGFIGTQKIVEYEMPKEPLYKNMPTKQELDQTSKMLLSKDPAVVSAGEIRQRQQVDVLYNDLKKDIDKSFNNQPTYEMGPDELKTYNRQLEVAHKFSKQFYDPRNIGPGLNKIKRFLNICGDGAAIAAIKNICQRGSIAYKIPADMRERIAALEQGYRDIAPDILALRHTNSDPRYANRSRGKKFTEVGGDYNHGQNVAHDPSSLPDIKPGESYEAYSARLEKEHQFDIWDE